MTSGTIQTFAKLGQMGRRSGSRDLLLNFGNPSISMERLKIQTSNVVCGLRTRTTIHKIAKLGQLGTGSGSRDLFLNFGIPSISKDRLKVQTSNFDERGIIQIFAKLGQ